MFLCLTVGLLTQPILAQDASTLIMQKKALAMRRAKQYSEAEKYLAEELTAAGDNLGKKLRVYIALAQTAYAADKNDETKKYIDLANEILEKSPGTGAEAKLADLTADYYCEKLKNYKTGLPYREKALLMIAKIYPVSDPHISGYEKSLAAAYKAIGHKEKAAALEVSAENRTASFTDIMQRIIKGYWHPTIPESSKIVLVDFTYGENGRISNVRIRRSSGDTEYDKYCVSVLDEVQLLPVKTWEFDPSPIEVEFHFDINLFKQGKSEFPRAHDIFSGDKNKDNLPHKFPEI